MNHEFLADEAVINSCSDTVSYQMLLFKKASSPTGNYIASQFNFSITKKRFIMMTKTKNTLSILKQIATAPLFASTLWVFSNKLIAQKSNDSATFQFQTSKLADTVVIQNQFDDILNKYASADSIKNGNRKLANKLMEEITKEDKKTLYELYKKMSPSQKNRQFVIFFKHTVLPKITPSKEQFEAFKNAQQYGIWIDEKKVSNDILNKYSNTDFSHFFISKLYGFAKKDKTYNYQVDLMTNNYYAKYLKKELEQKVEIDMLVKWFPKEKSKDKK